MATAVAQAAMIAACSPARLHDALPPGRLILQLPGIVLSSAIFQHRVARVLVPARLACQAGSDPVGLAPSASKELEVEDLQTSIPNPIVNIDQYSDPFATVVEMSYGTRLGALLDTIQALTDLGLNVVRGYVSLKAADVRTNRFYITRARGSQALAVNWDDGAKVEDPQLLESIRLTIINNLLQYHPESSERLAMGEAFGATAPPQKLDVDIATHINVTKLGPDRSLLKIETADRPGLLIEILKVLSDISVVVESAELDTEGLVAKDQLYVSYHGEALSPSMEEVIKNCLQYYLRRPTTEEDSY